MNNRQAGRRRGRGGQRSQGGGNPNRPDNGNRIDNRARGNAAQLLEKYKNLARDAQMQGDRVNTEYYLQFADHYFRVLNESRSRFEESRRTRDDRDDNASFEDEDEELEFDGEGQDDEREQPRNARNPRGDRPDRGERQPRDERQNRSDNRDDRPARLNGNGAGHGQVNGDATYRDTPAEAAASDAGEAQPPRRGRRPRRDADAPAAADAAPAGIEADRLPPAFGADLSASEPSEEGSEEGGAKPRRRRRTRGAEEDAVA